jgi:hypothetical protein
VPDPVRFVAADGVEYRVLDAAMRAGKLIVANPPVPWATSRVFRPREGPRRLYTFAKGESRAPEPVALEQQLRAAEYLPTESFDPRERRAR